MRSTIFFDLRVLRLEKWKGEKSVLREKQNKDRVCSLSAWIYRGRFQRILHNSCLDLAVNSSSFITLESNSNLSRDFSVNC